MPVLPRRPEDETPRQREVRLGREARAQRLGCSPAEAYAVERLEDLQAALRPLPEAEARARLEAEHAARVDLMALFAQNHMDFTLDERARTAAEEGLLGEALADPGAFLAADEADLLARFRRRHHPPDMPPEDVGPPA